MNNVLLVTVTEIETRAVLDVFGYTSRRLRRKHIGHKTYFALGKHKGAKIYLVQSEMGAIGPGASLQTVTEAIKSFSPVAVIMVGIAFGVDPSKQKLGDILVSGQISSYELQKVKDGGIILHRGDRVKASESLLDKFRSCQYDWNGADIHIGIILSGEKLIASQTFRDELIEYEPEALGGEMEGAGVYAAANGEKVDWILVKSISDWADGYKNSASQPIAASNAAKYVFHVIKQGGLIEDSDSEPNERASDLQVNNIPQDINSNVRTQIELTLGLEINYIERGVFFILPLKLSIDKQDIAIKTRYIEEENVKVIIELPERARRRLILRIKDKDAELYGLLRLKGYRVLPDKPTHSIKNFAHGRNAINSSEIPLKGKL